MRSEMKIADIHLSSIKEKIVAIVRFGPFIEDSDGMKSGEYFQVTIDPKKISPSGEFIRFGNEPGDEITGWQRCASMCIVEILGAWQEDGLPPLLQYGNQGYIKMTSRFLPNLEE